MIKDFFAGRFGPIPTFIIALFGDQVATLALGLVASAVFAVFGGLFENLSLLGDRFIVIGGFALFFGLYVLLPAALTFAYIKSIRLFPATFRWGWLQILCAVILVVKAVGTADSIGALGYMAYTDIVLNG